MKDFEIAQKSWNILWHITHIYLLFIKLKQNTKRA
jgi:hypothetical protein